jgi:hypothetical protein
LKTMTFGPNDAAFGPSAKAAAQNTAPSTMAMTSRPNKRPVHKDLLGFLFTMTTPSMGGDELRSHLMPALFELSNQKHLQQWVVSEINPPVI